MTGSCYAQKFTIIGIPSTDRDQPPYPKTRIIIAPIEIFEMLSVITVPMFNAPNEECPWKRFCLRFRISKIKLFVKTQPLLVNSTRLKQIKETRVEVRHSSQLEPIPQL